MVTIRPQSYSSFSMESVIQPLQHINHSSTSTLAVQSIIRDILNNPTPLGTSNLNLPFIHPTRLKNVTEEFGSSQSSEAPSFDRIKAGAVMEKGQEGQAVKDLQKRLTAIGFGVDTTGVFGSTTEAVLKEFQSSFGVQPTGKLGKTTLKTLEQAEKNLAPSLSKIRQHKAYIKRGMTGQTIKTIQKLLTKKGYPVAQTGLYGKTTQGLVRKFQKDNGLGVDGLVGRNTLKALESKETSSISGYSPAKGTKLAKNARRIANRMRSTGWCYKGSGNAIHQSLGIPLWGMSAYMAANQLAKSPKVKEVKLKSNDLKKLPPGAIVVWGKTPVSRHGHISVSLGGGLEASDHVTRQMTSLRGFRNFRVFVPIE